MKNREELTHLLPTEHQIQTLIKNYLTAKGWFCMRLNSGRIPMTDYNGRKRMIWMGEAGTPDLMAFRKIWLGDVFLNARPGVTDLLFIEVKRPGKKPTFNQEQMMKLLEEKGARGLVIHSLEELQKEGL